MRFVTALSPEDVRLQTAPTFHHLVDYYNIVQIRQEYGTRLAFYGGIDKHVLRRSRAEIVAELEYKIPPLAALGGCVLGLDHRIPNGTPLANYRFYIQKAWEILGRCAARL